MSSFQNTKEKVGESNSFLYVNHFNNLNLNIFYFQTERNKLVNHIQSCNQKSIELREKCRMLANELEILRTCAVNYDKFVYNISFYYFYFS